MKLKPEWVVIIILAVLLVVIQQCGNKLGLIKPKVEYTEVVKWDTAVVNHTDTFKISSKDSVYLPKYVYVDTGRVDTVIKKMTQEEHIAALRDYFSLKVYLDTLEGENYSVIALDSLQENSILGRKFTVSVDERIITKEVTKYAPPKFKFYVGGGVTFSTKSNIPFDVSPALGFAPRNDNFLYTMQYNILNKGASATFYYKLRFK
jgi:hypothetical protein